MLGETISYYRILEKLGQGGMGEVYLAEDTRLERKVALKFLAPELCRDRQSLARFRTEAKAAAELSHPNIAVIHDIGEADGRPFMVLEYVSGKTLQDRIAQGPLAVDEVLSVGRAIAAGLVEAHSHGIVHRDIKSANVMLTDKGEIKILDFGLARRRDATRLTRPGSTLGTMHYMSPEQATGEAADERSDIWSLGVVLYQCLTGRLPFVGENASILEQIKSSEVTPPTALRTGIPMELEQTVLRCLEKDPALRYQHADDFLAKLRVIGSHQQHGAAMAAPHAPAARMSKPVPRLGAALRTALIVVGITVCAGVILRLKQTPLTGPKESEVSEASVAVIDFRNPLTAADVTSSAMLTSLVQVGLIEMSPCHVLSLEYLKDVRRRSLGMSTGPILESEAIAVARAAGASALVFGDVAQQQKSTAATWRLIDSATGVAIGASYIEGYDHASLADSIVAGVLHHLYPRCGQAPTNHTVSVAQLTTQSEEAYRLYTSGRLARMEMRLADAQQHFEKAIAADSTFALAYLRLSEVAKFLGQPDRAADAVEKAWELKSRLGIKDRLDLEATRELSRGNRKAANDTYEEMLSRWPENREALVHVARLRMSRGFEEEALALLERGSRLYPDDRQIENLFVYNLLRVNRVEEAVALARELTETTPDNPNAWDTLGDLYLAVAEIDSARIAFRRALDVDSDFWLSTQGLARCDFSSGNVDGAIDRLNAALEQPRLPHVFRQQSSLMLAEWYLHSGRVERALQLLAGMADTTSDVQAKIAYRMQLAVLNLMADKPDASLAILDDISAQSDSLGIGTSEPWDLWYGMALIQSGASERARANLEVLRSRSSIEGPHGFNRRAALLLKGWMDLQRNDPTAALTAAEEVTRPLPSLRTGGEHSTMLLVSTYRALGRLEDAAIALREVLRHSGGYALFHYELALVYEEMDRLEEAEAEYSRFLNMWADADEGLPQLQDARRRLEELSLRS